MRNCNETVTVLMPVYNGDPYLARAIESVRCQTHPDFEFLVVDDGSTDGSGEILERMAAQEPRLRIVRGMHEGVAAALNRGLALAKGSIIVRMDQDDVAMPQRVERQLAFLAENPEVVAVGSALQLIDKNGCPMGEPTDYPLTAAEIRRDLLMGYCSIGHPTVAMRRDPVLAVGGYKRSFESAEDFDLWLRLSERHALANMPEVLLQYRWHGANATVRRRRQQALATHIARLAAGERQLGQPDPTAGLEKLSLSDLDRFSLPPHERAALLFELSEAGLIAYEATGEARHLADVEETLFAREHPRGARARGLAVRLVRHLWKAGLHVRAIAGVVWKLRAEMSSVARRASPLIDMIDMARLGRRRAIRSWLIHCADPQGPRTAQPRRSLSPEEAGELVAQADMHGVLPAVLRHFPPFQNDAAYAGVKADALARHRSKLAYSLMLRTHGEAVLAAAADLPVVMVKGPVFSRTIYPATGLRNFTDIDLLVAPEAEPQLARVLEMQGYSLAEGSRDRQEWKWLHRDNEALMIEVHTNLVHHPELRAGMSVTFQDLAGIAETPAALLIVALAHGALERYELLRQLVDVCQAARRVDTAEEQSRLEALVQRTGTRLAAVAGLDLAYRLLGEPRCRDLARALAPARYSTLARLLLSRSAITSTMSSTRFLRSWQRQGFRILLKRKRTF